MVFYCAVLIVVIIVIIVVVYFVVTNKSSSSTKRSLAELADMSVRSLAPVEVAARNIAGRYVLPNVDQGNAARVATLPVAMGYGAQ